MEANYNSRNPAVKRLFREAQELAENPDEDFHAGPLLDNLFEWHFTVRGPSETAFENGLYHGRVILPAEYPMKPPNIIILTPNGRFETNTKICLSISGYHPETWQPSWSIRTALKALIGFMPTPGNGAIGSLDLPDAHRKVLAINSRTWICPDCKISNCDLLPAEGPPSSREEPTTPTNAPVESGPTTNPFAALAAKIDRPVESPSDPPAFPPGRFDTDRASGDASPGDPNTTSPPIRPRTSSLNNRPGRGAGKRAHFADEPSPTISPAIVTEPYSFPPRASPAATPIPEHHDAVPANSAPPQLVAQANTASSSGTDLNEMRQRQSQILQERRKVLRERLAHTERTATQQEQRPVGTFGITDTSRLENMITMMRQIVIGITVCLVLIVFRRLILVLQEDEFSEL